MFKTLKTIVISLFALLVGMALLWDLDIRVQYFNDNTLQPTLIKGVNFPKTLVDATGEEYLLDDAPRRIVSVTLGTDEMLSELVDDKRVIGVTNLVDDIGISNIPHKYPSHVKRIRGEIEGILALEPDLVFVASYTRAETVRLLLGAGIPVVRLSGYSTLQNIEENILTVAQITDSEDRALALIENLQAGVEKVTNRIQGQQPPRVLYYNLKGYTAGIGSTVDEMIQIAGGYNVVHETGIKGSHKINEEMAIGLEPDVILMSGWTQDGKTSPAELLMQNPAWQHVPAVLNNRVYNLQGAWVLSVSQYSWDGIKHIAALLHPEVFE
jgi:cobalamin transport system substrate-binding protein